MCPSGMRSPSAVSASIPKNPRNLRSFLDSGKREWSLKSRRSAPVFNMYCFRQCKKHFGKLIAIIRVAYDDTFSGILVKHPHISKKPVFFSRRRFWPCPLPYSDETVNKYSIPIHRRDYHLKALFNTLKLTMPGINYTPY